MDPRRPVERQSLDQGPVEFVLGLHPDAPTAAQFGIGGEVRVT